MLEANKPWLVFRYVAGGDDWKIVAEELGLTPLEIRFLDNRAMNPADVALSYVASQRLFTVGNLYDVLAGCSLPLIADDLWKRRLFWYCVPVAFLEASTAEPPIAETSHRRVPSISGQRQTTIPMRVDTNARPKGVHLLEDRT